MLVVQLQKLTKKGLWEVIAGERVTHTAHDSLAWKSRSTSSEVVFFFQDFLDLLDTIFNCRDLTNMDRLDVASYANTFLYCIYPSSKTILEGCGSGDHFLIFQGP